MGASFVDLDGQPCRCCGGARRYGEVQASLAVMQAMSKLDKSKIRQASFDQPEMSGDWNELRLVLAIARARGLIGAAQALGIDHSTAFRRLAALEKRLGQLFERLPGGAYEPGPVAERMARAAERMEDEALALARD